MSHLWLSCRTAPEECRQPLGRLSPLHVGSIWPSPFLVTHYLHVMAFYFCLGVMKEVSFPWNLISRLRLSD